MAEESDLEKNEAPTSHRLKKAREEGQVPRSKELVSWLMLLTGCGLLWLAGSHITGHMAQMLQSGLTFDYRVNGDVNLLLQQLKRLVASAIWAIAPLGMGLLLVGVSSPMLLGGILFSSKAVRFDLKRLNPISGFKKLFSMQTIAEMVKTLFKVLLVGWTCGVALWLCWPRMARLMQGYPRTVMGESLGLVEQSVLIIIIGLIPVVGFDIVYQLFSTLKKLRMSRKEIRDEYKQQEGDPLLKQVIRQRQRQMAQRRMMASVPQADVVITNPSHYAVALQYHQGRMSAPKVLAKGAGAIALRIRALADEHRIPTLEAPPLARALFRHSEIGQPIPVALYGAVAEVLAWVYGLRRWRKEGGLIPRQPKNIPVPSALDFKRE